MEPGGLATLPPSRPAPALSPSLRGGRGRPGFKSQVLSRSVTKLRPCSLSERAAAPPDSVPRAARHSSWCQHLGTVLRAVVLPRSTHSLAAGSRILPATRSANPGRRLRRRPKKTLENRKSCAHLSTFSAKFRCLAQTPALQTPLLAGPAGSTMSAGSRRLAVHRSCVWILESRGLCPHRGYSTLGAACPLRKLSA